MNEKSFSRLPLVLFWIIPATSHDVITDLSSHPNITDAGSLLVTCFLTVVFMVLWVWSGWSTFRDARSHFVRGAFSSGWVAKFEGELFLMLPADLELQDAIRTGNKTVEDFIKTGRGRA